MVDDGADRPLSSPNYRRAAPHPPYELEALLDEEVTGNAERALFGLTPKPAADSSGSYGERAESGEGKIGSGVV